MRLESFDGSKKLLNEFIEFVESNEEIIIFGAGVGGTDLMAILEEKSLVHKICCLSDNSELKFNKEFYGKVILNPTELYKKYPNAKVVIASSAYKEILNQLIGYGYCENDIKLFNFAFMEFQYTDKEFIYDNLNEFKRIYDRMEDQKSKAIIEIILNYKITKDEKWLEDLSEFVDDEKYQYFDASLININLPLNIVDVGGFIGDTFLQYAELGYTYENYYCFEADPEVFKVLENNTQSYENVKLFNIGLWNEKGMLHFSNLNPGSTTITEDLNNETSIEVDKLDNLIEDRIDFIKLDIEGAEYNALLGMEQVIKSNLPIIAFAAYHKRDDYFTLTDLIEKFAPNQYKFYLRQYRYTPTETICYAIPKVELSD